MKKDTISSKPSAAAGPKAILVASAYAWKHMSVVKTVGILSKLNQKEGIDCPGCAWPDPKSRSSLGEFCENGVKAITEEATDKKVDLSFFDSHSVLELQSKDEFWLSQQGRLLSPMFLDQGEEYYQQISWQDAFDLIAHELKNLTNPNEAVFYTSGRTSNEAAFLYQLMARRLGTNNLPDCSNMCHESSGVALTETLGIGKGSVELEDFYKSDLIIILGQNPGTNHPRMLNALEKAKKSGARIISVNPLKEVGLVRFRNPQNAKGWISKGTALTDLHLPIKINQDVSLLKALMIRLLELSKKDSSILDKQFIADKTEGFDQLTEHLTSQNFDLLLESTGIDKDDFDDFVKMVAKSKKIICCWAMGLTQHENGVDNIREVVNLLLMKGSIGKPGAGTCPVRGHSNVQGDRTVGIVEKPSRQLIDRISDNFGFNVPEESGYNTVETIEEMAKGKVKFFMGLGGNFAAATPDTERVRRAMANCELTVQVSTKLNRSHLHTGKKALILPCLGRTDKIFKDGKTQKLSVENSMGQVHSTQGFVNPPSADLLPEPDIIAGIATAVFGENDLPWQEWSTDYSLIRDLIEKTVEGFENYNKRLAIPGGFALPNGPREGKFPTSGGRAKFTINKPSEVKVSRGELLLMTIRSHDQFNTTIYDTNDRYRGVNNERRVVFMNKADMAEQGLKAGMRVEIKNLKYDLSAEGFLIRPYDIPKGCIASYFPEANAVIPSSVYARGSNTPAYKSVVVTLKQSADNTLN